MGDSIAQTRTAVVAADGRLGTFGAGAFAWHGISRYILAWRHRWRSREELFDLSDEVLQDIGITRPAATRDVVKPIWMP